MSKSFDNYIGLAESPESMYPKLMKVPDTLLPDYIRLLTHLPVEQTLSLGPVGAHHALATAIVSDLHGAERAQDGRRRYEQVASGRAPDVMPDVTIAEACLSPDGAIGLVDLVVHVGFAKSKGEARRLIQGRGIRVDGSVVEECSASLLVRDGMILQRGKNQFLRVRTNQVPERKCQTD